MGRSRKRSPWRLLGAAAIALTLGLAVTANAGATLYSAKISPTAADAGSTATYTITIRNLLGPGMGSANVQIPDGWTEASVGTPTVLKAGGAVSDREWTAELDGSTLELRAASGSGNKVPILWSVRVSLEATAPCEEGVSAFGTAARTGSDFSGLWFIRFGPKPKVAVSGTCAVAHHLDFDQQPGQTVLGEAIAPAVTVRVENEAGDQVDYDGAVALTASGPGSFTGGSTTTVNAVDGLATFDDLELDTVGTYTLEATSGSLLPDTSDPFDVVWASEVVGEGETSGTNCSDSGDATDGIPTCVGVQLPNGANGPVSLVTTAPDPEAPEGTDEVNSVLGNFKDGEGEPLYTEDDPATVVLEYDATTLPSCGGLYDRALLGYYYGDYYPDREVDLLLNEPRTCLELFAQFTQGGTWHPVPVCAEYHDYPEDFDEVPDGDEEFWYDSELGFGSLFDDDDTGGFEAGACMAASHFDDEGDLVLYVLFFGDPSFTKR